ncbi:MAG: translation initiation factor IF-2 N-terminal domain-containing protein, partial [Candidatus Omnitrophica bacterium]|nr:translation initiation factor IF-2 N-terminal domain-containing protein [Candidatus Omnitrophota bacterium]
MGVRVHQIAKELGIPSKELVEKLNGMGVSVKGHMSALEESVAAEVRAKLGSAAFAKAAKAEKPKKAPEPVPAPPKPVAAPAPAPKATPPRPVASSAKADASAKAPAPKQPAYKPSMGSRPGFRPKSGRRKQAVPPPINRVELPPIPVPDKNQELRDLTLDIPLTVKDFAIKLGLKPSQVIQILMKQKVFANINQYLDDEELISNIALEYGFIIQRSQTKEEELLAVHDEEDKDEKRVSRPPVVTFMGHVDHGKTSLLDMIRKAKVAEGEIGGITQHVAAYEVVSDRGRITFLDTPGHAAFTQMRARGANATDIVVLVVAADDGIMAQTDEAIDHARAANVPLVVAINKVDLPTANVDRVKQQLAERDLTPEDWGGKTITVEVSAKTGQGIDDLLEMMILEAEILELKANPKRLARGVVVEAHLSPRGGSMATVITQDGMLHVGDPVLCGDHS